VSLSKLGRSKLGRSKLNRSKFISVVLRLVTLSSVGESVFFISPVSVVAKDVLEYFRIAFSFFFSSFCEDLFFFNNYSLKIAFREVKFSLR
jgi:hypothetical protein